MQEADQMDLSESENAVLIYESVNGLVIVSSDQERLVALSSVEPSVGASGCSLANGRAFDLMGQADDSEGAMESLAAVLESLLDECFQLDRLDVLLTSPAWTVKSVSLADAMSLMEGFYLRLAGPRVDVWLSRAR